MIYSANQVATVLDLMDLPDDLPNGRQYVDQGKRKGARITLGSTPFCQMHGVRSEAQYKLECADAGRTTWSTIMGLSTVEEQVAGLQFLERFGRETTMAFDRGLVISNWLSGIPPALREGAPAGTSFILDGIDDHVRIAHASTIQPCFNDWHIGSPYCLENTAAAVTAGGSYHGVLAQLVWDLPRYRDDVAHVVENLSAIGLVAAKRDDWLVVDSYMDDGMPSRFLDNVSLVGWALLERYVVEDLCGARYATGFGGLMSNLETKTAVWLALYEVLKAEHPCLSYLYGNTISPAREHIVQNFGLVAGEMGVFAAVERRYRTGVSLLPTPITEGLAVPTREAIADVRLVAGRAAERACEFERLISWPTIEATRDLLVERGREFAKNALALLEACGVDVLDPLQVLIALRRIGARRLESLCHPGDGGCLEEGEVAPFVPTELALMAEELAQEELARVHDRGCGPAVKGRRFLVASGDTHWCGAYAAARVLRNLGAEAIEAGVELDPEEVVSLAETHDWPVIAVSTHNGQCLDYGRRLAASLRQHGCECLTYMGGKLNAIPRGASVPMDCTAELTELGLIPCTTVADLVEHQAGQGDHDCHR